MTMDIKGDRCLKPEVAERNDWTAARPNCSSILRRGYNNEIIMMITAGPAALKNLLNGDDEVEEEEKEEKEVDGTRRVQFGNAFAVKVSHIEDFRASWSL